ncbi:MAG: NTP transferase domain-containing protein, partial [Caldisphaera sp.]|nr:NTP transferase domain-containing protein [Caldisphaera sp.]
MRIPISIIMAGGKGTRFNSSYKPFTKICGKPMIINILEVASYISDFIAIAISENTEKYVDILKNTNALIIYTPGINYSVDLSILLNIIKKRPILILPSDFPFLN